MSKITIVLVGIVFIKIKKQLFIKRKTTISQPTGETGPFIRNSAS